MVGEVVLQLVHGDIIHETTDVIVNTFNIAGTLALIEEQLLMFLCVFFFFYIFACCDNREYLAFNKLSFKLCRCFQSYTQRSRNQCKKGVSWKTRWV